VAKISGITLKESDIQRTICDFLRAERWHVFEFEQEWSERKKKLLGEEGMPDVLAIRYGFGEIGFFNMSIPNAEVYHRSHAEVLWCEMKRIDKRGRLTKATPKQREWKLLEQKRGALCVTLGEEMPASFEGFWDWYVKAGLQRR
jgi:hypothetical protein